MSDRIVIVGGGMAAARVSPEPTGRQAATSRVTMLSAEAGISPTTVRRSPRALLRGSDRAGGGVRRSREPRTPSSRSTFGSKRRERRSTRERRTRSCSTTARSSATTGSCSQPARPPASSGFPARQLEGVFSYRNPRRCTRQSARRPARPSRVLVVGAGFIGMETAASLRERGLDVTVIEPGRPALRSAPAIPSCRPRSSSCIANAGVELMLGDVVAGAPRRRQPQLDATTRDRSGASRRGSRSSASASNPATAYLAGAGIALDAWCRRGRRALQRRPTRVSSRLATSRASTIRWPDAGD